MVDSNTLKSYMGKIIDWILYLGLIFASGFFMNDCVDKFKNESTYFEVASEIGEPIKLPTLTICFKPCFKESGLKEFNLTDFQYFLPRNVDFSTKDVFENSAYEIGRDFNLSITYLGDSQIMIDKPSKIEIASVKVEVKTLVTQYLGKCYKIILNGTTSNLLVMLFKIEVSLNKNLVSKPNKVVVSKCDVRVHVASEYN